MFSGLTQRESCLKCKYHSYNRNTDFTCGDFHRYHGSVEFKDNYGISEILVNTHKGSEILNDHMDCDLFLLCTKEEVWQPLLSGHININMNKRDKFWRIYKTNGYKKATDIIMPKVYRRHVKQKLARMKQNLEKLFI